MKIEDLMIGDWFYDVSICQDKDDPNDEYREARRVGSIEHFQYDKDDEPIYRMNANYSQALNWLPSQEHNIRPIPVTDEILELNGFKNHVYQDLYGRTVIVENNCIDCLLDGSRLLHLKYSELYVHELQHALHICGLRYNAKNFVVNAK